MSKDEVYIERCIELAQRGKGKVSPNPMVGAVLVHESRIIGEGYHMLYGRPHAEVNCIDAVVDADKNLISHSTLFVSLEPCAHFGKTPPCADLIIQHKIPHVVIGCRDPFEKVNGKGIEKLESAGIKVTLIGGHSEKKCIDLNKNFFVFHQQQRPRIILKWAQTLDGFIASFDKSNRLLISSDNANRVVHKWRSEEDAILVGTNTAMSDDPQLTTRSWPGKNPLRLVIDMELKLPSSLKLFNNEATTIVFNELKHTLPLNLTNIELKNSRSTLYYKVESQKSLSRQICEALFSMEILSVVVEGGQKLLQHFIDEDCWDEARIIKSKDISVGKGLAAPAFNKPTNVIREIELIADTLLQIKNPVLNP